MRKTFTSIANNSAVGSSRLNGFSNRYLPSSLSSQSQRKEHQEHQKKQKNHSTKVIDEAKKEQNLRDYKLSIEFKRLKDSAPGGVYIIPSLNDIRFFHGIIFVRKGSYRQGVFKFQVKLPKEYNDVGTYPNVNFTSQVYHPLIHPKTGRLNIRQVFPGWNPTENFLVTLLTYIKQIFYTVDYKVDLVQNYDAFKLFKADLAKYNAHVKQCVEKSIEEQDEMTKAVEPLPQDNTSVGGLEKHVGVWSDLKKEFLDDPKKVSSAGILAVIQNNSTDP